MDANKLKKLKDISYSINPSCSTCIHSYFTYESDWGICKKHSYSHSKHTVKARSLSIHRAGSCPDFQMSNDKENSMNHYKEFFK